MSLSPVWLSRKLVKAIAAAGKDFMREWSKSTKDGIDAVSDEFSGLVTRD